MVYINTVDGEKICKQLPHLNCNFCMGKVEDNTHQLWFVPTDL